MSFMSFDYAMRAADAALQFHQNQGQNIKDTGQKVRDVGNRNAQSKDQLVRQKIEAEYQAKSATIKKEKLEALANLAKKRKESAMLAQMIVGAGGMLGGMIDGMIDMANKDKDQAPDADQIGMASEHIGPREDGSAGYAVGFRIASQTGNSEHGAIAAFDPDRGTFSVTGVNTTTGEITGFTTLSATDMAMQIQNAIGSEAGNANNAALANMIEPGPPPMFKAEHFQQKDGKVELSNDLRNALFSDGGFFAQGSRRSDAGTMLGSDAGERVAAGLVQRGLNDFSFYNQSASGIMRMMRSPEIQRGLMIDSETVGKTNQSLRQANAFGRGALGEGFQKILLKPLGTTLPQFIKLAEVSKQYEEEYQAKLKEAEQAKKQAAAAWEKVNKLEGLLAAGNDA
ncbi:MAG: hypothetical protein IGS03_06195 [Candidatus Sericytochromatia bacterium]|nr:hypothetical protein [Candidatus Sericytochromatia bacterium]